MRDILEFNKLSDISVEDITKSTLSVMDWGIPKILASIRKLQDKDRIELILNKIIEQDGNKTLRYEKCRYDDKTMRDIWKQAVQENTELRILQNNRIVSVNASFFDQLIQHQIKPHLSREEIAVNSVLQIQKEYGYIISIYYVFYRLRVIKGEEI